MLGDIVIAKETINTECFEQKKSFKDHLAHMFIHGFLHLTGFMHENDDDTFGGDGWELFGEGGVPYNVVINHNMEIVLSVAGFQDEAIYSAINAALDSCGVQCIPGCSDIPGEIDGTFTIDNEPIINVMDLLKLSDIIADGFEIDNCLAITGDLTDDGIITIIDVYAFASMLSQGDFDN